MRMVKVPMAVDAKVTIPVGPVNLPMRAVLLLILVTPLAYICLTALDGTLKYVLPMCLYAVAGMVGLPEREGVWIGTFVFFNMASPILPRIVRGGRTGRGRVRRIGQGMSVGKVRRPLPIPPPVSRWTALPRAGQYEGGLLKRRPGGWCAVVTLKGPDSAPHTDAYADWCGQVLEWLLAVESPAQVLARTVHYDRAEVEATYEANCAVLHTKLGQFERQLSGDVADRTMVMEHHVVFMPGTAGKDGVPYATDAGRLSQAADTPRADAERALQSAVRLASTFGVEVLVPSADQVAALSQHTVLGAPEAMTSQGMTLLKGSYHGYLAVTALPPKLMTGGIVSALMRARGQGMMSMHVLPVDVATARSKLNKIRAAYRYASRNSSDVDTQMMAADTEALIAALAGRQVLAVRAGLLMSVSGHSPDDCSESLARLHAALAGEGIRTEHVTSPAFVAASAISPGGVPLRRTLLLTTDGVATCLLPAMGTPFGDPAQPMLGINAATGAPVYLDVFRRANHNAVIVGTSGAGKSVSCKTMLLRHVAQGARTIVIDPDSEYGLVMRALNGRYVELGEASINVLAMDPGIAPDEAAGMIIPVLSVMGGEEVGYKDGRPIRRLNDADKAWLHEELVHFLSTWYRFRPQEEPVLTNLIEHLMTEAAGRCTSDQQRERCREIGLRLRGFTQGPRARIFDRPSSFSLDHPVMGIGLRELALQFRADITPAMAVVLTRILQQLARRQGKLVVLVDEAHRVTSDPDASQVLDQLVRQARKYGAGVWMASQAVDDFVRTELGRILAATAATKLILGIEQTVAAEAQSAFGIANHEMSALTPRFSPGVGVLISGPERAVVQVLPGDHLMPLVSTSPALTGELNMARLAWPAMAMALLTLVLLTGCAAPTPSASASTSDGTRGCAQQGALQGDLAAAPAGLKGAADSVVEVMLAATNAQSGAVDCALLLALAKQATDFGRQQSGHATSGCGVPQSVIGEVAAADLQPGGRTMQELGMPQEQRTICDWVDAQGDFGFLHYPKGSWEGDAARVEAAIGGGGRPDPYSPDDAMLTAALALSTATQGGGDRRTALSGFLGGDAAAGAVLDLVDKSGYEGSSSGGSTGGSSGSSSGSSTRGSDAACAAAGNCTPQGFADAILVYPGVNAPITAANEYAIEAWERIEGGNWNNSASGNPLNTTQKEPGSTSINSVGVQAFHDAGGHTSWYWGIKANGDTLQNGRYGPILSVLRSPAASGKDQCLKLAGATGSTPWGTGNFSSVC